MAEHEKNYKVISTKLIGGRPLSTSISEEAPGDGFTAASLTSKMFSSARSWRSVGGYTCSSHFLASNSASGCAAIMVWVFLLIIGR